MIWWPWLIFAFFWGWTLHSKLIKFGIKTLRKRGLKISFPDKNIGESQGPRAR